MLIQNLAIQLSVLLLGIIGGIILHWLAAEEIPLYTQKLRFIQKALFIATFITALFFSSNVLLIAFLAVSYGVMAFPQKNEFQIFSFIAPLVLFLSTQTKEGFFLTSTLFFLSCVVSSTLITDTIDASLGKKIKENIFQWSGFIVVTLLVYGIVFVVTLF